MSGIVTLAERFQGAGGLMVLVYHHGWTDGLAGATISALVHAVINGFVFRLMRHLTLFQSAVLVVVVLGGVFMWTRARDRRGW